jgi:type IV secretion system protein VirB8
MTDSSAPLEYFEAAESWDADRTRNLERTSRIAWRVAAAAGLCAVASSLAIALMMPLKRVEPFVVRVDNTTGIVDIVPVVVGGAAPGEAVTRYFVSHYVTICERFNHATAESDYEECGAFHSTARNQEWYAAWARTNPASPLNLHADGSTVRAEVESVSFFTRASGIADLAQVRYRKLVRAGLGASDQVSHWIATINFAYADPAKEPRIRRWNPLGFKIVEFHSEPEVIAELHAGGVPPTSDAGRPEAGRKP